jgi:hypothetical protein
VITRELRIHALEQERKQQRRNPASAQPVIT